jgi:D-arabinose 1-dehydrogenase-like Zn-dependent alcohol dehydrogenase
MAKTYKAVEVSAPRVLRVVERAIPAPGPGQVRIGMQACGICHTDSATVTGAYPGLKLPRVPEHEVVGRIEALGRGVSMENRSAGWCQLDRRGRRGVRTAASGRGESDSRNSSKW